MLWCGSVGNGRRFIIFTITIAIARHTMAHRAVCCGISPFYREPQANQNTQEASF